MTTPAPRPKFKRNTAKTASKQNPKKRDYKGFYPMLDSRGEFSGKYRVQFSDGDGNRVQKVVRAASDKEATEMRAVEIARAKEKRETGSVETPSTDTFEQFTDEFLKNQKVNLRSEVEYQRQRGVVLGGKKDAKSLTHYFGKKRLSAISRADVIDWLTERKQQVSAGTVLKERNILRRLFSYAIEKEKLIQNPATGPAVKKHAPKQPKGRADFLQPEQWLSVYRACRIDGLPDHEQWLQNFSAVTLSLGTRRGELLKVELPDIDMNKGIVLLRHTKNGEEREAYMNELTYEVLIRMRVPERIERGDHGLLFTGFTAELASVKFIRACESVSVENISLHSLRHTYASWAHMSGADPASTKAQLGHKTDSMMDRYRHLLPNHRAKQAAALNGVFSLPPGNTIEGEAVKALPAPDSDRPTS